MYRTLIAPQDLQPFLDHPDWVVVDCRHSFDDSTFGKKAFREGHIPGALHADLDRDLCGEIVKGKTSRHPLPNPEKFANHLSKWGIDERVQVVAYDGGELMFATRLWWMLRWVGHCKVAVLDGGYPRWKTEGYPISLSVRKRVSRCFIPKMDVSHLADSSEVMSRISQQKPLIFDSREWARYTASDPGPDPINGHISSALCFPSSRVIDSEGKLLPPEEMVKLYEEFMERSEMQHAVFYCGSGVRATIHAFAMVYAGLPEPKIYMGSWSEWILDPSHPISNGEQTK